jgi:hypothetical protein
MAGTSRALTLKLLADIDNFSKNINKADNEVTTFGDKISKFGKVAGAAFLAAGAAAAVYAGKLLVDGVKSAIEDEKAQAKLAATLKNVAGATNEAVAQTEKYITQTSLAFGVTDDQLRPSLERLARSTKDVTKAQELQSLALDIAAGSGKSLEAVSNALGRAYEGNTSSLGRLGIGISATELKTMSFDEVTKALANTFANQASVQADTFEGKMARLRISMDEAKETLGFALLPTLTSFVDYVVENILPTLEAFIGGLTGSGSLDEGFTDNEESAFVLGETVRELAKNLGDLFRVLDVDGKSSMQGFVTILRVVASVANGIVTVIKEITALIIEMANQAIRAKNFLLPGADTPYIPQIPGTVPGTGGLGVPNMNNSSLLSGGTVNNITVNGAIDSESTARQIVSVLNQSSYRGTLGAGAFA